MSGFEIITITFSFVLGLGIAQILSSVSSAIREYSGGGLYWAPFAVAASVFLIHVQFWFVLFAIDAAAQQWTWPLYGSLLFLAVVLFLSGGIVLPPASVHDLREDFAKRGKLSAVFLMVYAAGWIPLNTWLLGQWFVLPNLYNLFLIAVLAVVFWSKSEKLRGAAALGFLALIVYGLFFIYASPADLG